MRRRVVLLMAIVLLSFSGHFRPEPALAQTPPDWLVAINAIRTAAGLQPVTQNMATTLGATHHSLYVVRNNFGANGGVNPHIEDPNLPGFTADGAQAGASGDIAFQFGGPPPAFHDALAGWMTAAYHWEGFLDPGLTSVGYGVATFQDAFPNQPVPAFDPAHFVVTSTETLVFTRTFTNRTQAIMWPPNGGTMPFTSNTGGETPNPLASCPGYAAANWAVTLTATDGRAQRFGRSPDRNRRGRAARLLLVHERDRTVHAGRSGAVGKHRARNSQQRKCRRDLSETTADRRNLLCLGYK